MKIRIQFFLLTTLFFLLVQNVMAQSSDEKLREIIQSIDKETVKAFMNKDIETLSNYYTDDVISMPNFSTTLEGKEAMAKHLKSAFATGVEFSDWESTIKKIWKKGDQIYVVSTFKMTVHMPGGEPMDDEGKGFTVFQKVGKEYKVKVEIWNTDLNPWMQQ